jgi:carbonic anhydrase
MTQAQNALLKSPLAAVGLALTLLAAASTHAADPAHPPAAHAEPAKKPVATATAPAAASAKAVAPPAPMTPKEIGNQVREAVEIGAANKTMTLMVNGKDKKYITIPAVAKKEAAHSDGGHSPAVAVAAAPAHAAPGRIVNPVDSRQYIRAKAAALAGHGTAATADMSGGHGAAEAHWTYDGVTGPQAWGTMKPEFNVCAIGKRQSPINIEEPATLQGPAEPVRFNYQPSSGTVVNNGHTIQVDLYGDNAIIVRGSEYKLIQFHFHHPSEERVNYKSFAMVAHLVHKNAEGQLAVVAVLLEPGAANALINKVWTYMPLDSGDRVRMPAGLVEMTELLPADQRYYQFMGSLTTPPCSENVLWMVLKQPQTISREQIRLFSQLFPNNARPVQPVNGRAIRNAQ